MDNEDEVKAVPPVDDDADVTEEVGPATPDTM